MSGALLQIADDVRRAWDEYDATADKCAREGGWRACESVPPGVSERVFCLIYDDPEAFEARVRAFAYAHAMESIPAFANDGDGTDPEYTEPTKVDNATSADIVADFVRAVRS